MIGFMSLVFSITITGCDALYRALHKEGAEEKELFGEIVSFEYNAKVEELQRLLESYGYYAGEIDGKMGVNTRQAVSEFQKEHGLKVSRFVDKETWAALNVLMENGLIVQGEPNIKKIQQILGEEGFSPGAIDGKWGPRTEGAVKAFQKAHGLEADGAVGIKTLSKINEVLEKRQAQNP